MDNKKSVVLVKEEDIEVQIARQEIKHANVWRPIGRGPS